MKLKYLLLIIILFLCLTCRIETRKPMTKIDYYYLKINNKLTVDNVLINCRVRALSSELVFAIIKTESFFNPNAINDKNENGTKDFGLMQINELTYPHLSEKQLLNLQLNVYHGCLLLEELAKEFNRNEVKMIMAYNAGASRVRSGNIPQKTFEYVNKVLKYKFEYERDLIRMEVKHGN
jgi:soluble lytic murein transglycosylase-like protein